MIARKLSRLEARLTRLLLEPIDARVYAFVRMAYGVLCMCVVCETWPVRVALYSEGGLSMRKPDLPPYLIFKWVTSEHGVSIVMVVAGIAAVCMVLGMFTRLSAAVLYLWSFSYCATGYAAEAGYDAIVRIVGFVLMLSPTVRALSVDAKIFGPGDSNVPRYGLRLLQWQLALIYLMTFWMKAPDSYWRSGELVSYFMMSMYARAPSAAWAFLGRTSALLTWGALLMEALIPFLLFSRKYRRLGFLCGLALHGGIAASSTIVMFSLAMLPLYAAFVTREDIDALGQLLRRARRAVTLDTERAAR